MRSQESISTTFSSENPVRSKLFQAILIHSDTNSKAHLFIYFYGKHKKKREKVS